MTMWPPDFAAPPAAPQLAYFISSHGFGHAARACAVMNALHAQWPEAHFHLFTQTPEWFFRDSVDGPYTYHQAVTDVGLVQLTALVEDLPGTVAALDALYPLDAPLIATWANWLTQLDCVAVLCDIAPLGIAAARAADLPAILIENFTWDWIYDGYVDAEPRLRPHMDYLRALFAQADYHVQTTPFCAPHPRATLTTAPISRTPRQTRAHTRAQLGLRDEQPVALITMGGIPSAYTFYDQLHAHPTWAFVIPGAHATAERQGNVWLLPHRSDFYHPDLVQAADVVIGKVGYSTLAETYHAGAAFGYVPRPHFREGPVMADFIHRHLQHQCITPEAFAQGAWLAALPALLQPRSTPAQPNGAEQVAQLLMRLLAPIP